jgi:hypothetical protein
MRVTRLLGMKFLGEFLFPQMKYKSGLKVEVEEGSSKVRGLYGILTCLQKGGSRSKKSNGRCTTLSKSCRKRLRRCSVCRCKKIIYLHLSDRYSIVQGKAGETVELGIKGGINHIGVGFVHGFAVKRSHAAFFSNTFSSSSSRMFFFSNDRRQI